jgi:putative MATE family efflux protein
MTFGAGSAVAGSAEVADTASATRRRVLGLAVPMATEASMHNIFNFVELIWVARLGSTAVAAVGLAHVIMIAVMGLGFGWGAAGAAAVARRIGEGNPSRASAIATATILWGVIGTTVVGIVLGAVAVHGLSPLNLSRDVVDATQRYLLVGLGGVGLTSGANVAMFMLRAAGEARRSMLAFVAGTVVTLVLQPGLILGWWGAPNLGLLGAALAFVLGRASTLLIVLAFIASGRASLRVNGAAIGDWRALAPLVTIAGAGAGQALLRNVSPFGLYAIAAPLGTTVLAALNVVIKIQLIAQIVAQGLANAAGTLVGQWLGARRPDQAAIDARAAVRYGVIALSAIGLVVVAVPMTWAAPLTGDPAVRGTAAAGMRIVAVAFPFITAATVLAGALNGAGETRSPALVHLLCLGGLQIGAGALLVHAAGWHATGLWVAMALAWTVDAAWLAAVFARGHWRHVRV